MNSILNNSAALSALQALSMTQQSLATVQNQVSSGLAVATAADNSSYWSIGQSLQSDSGMVTAADSALSQGQSLLSTATSAINSVITTLNSMATQLTAAQQPGANTADINTAIAAASAQLAGAVKGASYNGLNVLDGSQAATMAFVSGFNASAAGGAVTTISFQTQALTGGAAAAATTTTTNSTDTSNAEITAIAGLTASTTKAVLAFGTDIITASTAKQPLGVSVESMDIYGNTTTTTYTALDANGNNSLTNGAVTLANAASLAVSTTTAITGTTSLLTQGAQDLTNGATFQIGGGLTAGAMLADVNQALAAVQNYSALIGATQDQMTSANTFNTSLTTNYANGVAGLVDADMNTASTRLQALQTQEQLGIQSLSIANQNAALVLKLFQ